jgi:nucleoside-diphosphate-sugar epimerase
LGSFQNNRSFLNVDNLSAVIARLCHGDVPSGIYNVADDEPLSSVDVVRLMAASMGRSARILNIPPALARALARVGDALRLPFNSERLSKMVEDYVIVNDKLLAALDWDAMPIGARKGITELGGQLRGTQPVSLRRPSRGREEGR